jgi:hypothetical protein
MAGNIPLLSDREMPGGGHEITLYLDPGLSTLTRTPNWPILLWNLVNWRVTALPGFSEPWVRLGTDASLKIPAEFATAELSGPDGGHRTMVNHGGEPNEFEPWCAGLYTARAGAHTFTLAANLLSPAETDLNGCAAGTWGDWTAPAVIRRDYQSSAWIFALLAIGLLVWHSARFCRFRTAAWRDANHPATPTGGSL